MRRRWTIWSPQSGLRLFKVQAGSHCGLRVRPHSDSRSESEASGFVVSSGLCNAYEGRGGLSVIVEYTLSAPSIFLFIQ